MPKTTTKTEKYTIDNDTRSEIEELFGLVINNPELKLFSAYKTLYPTDQWEITITTEVSSAGH